MSTRATIAAAITSLGLVGWGWQQFSPATASTSATSTVTVTATPDATSGSSPSSGSTGSSSSSGSSTSSAPSTTAASGFADGTYTGDTETFAYGSVQVTVTIENGQITSVTENLVDDGERKSQMINQRALPVLREEIVAANSADVSMVSGATFTSRAYLASLQSALDQA